MDTTKQYIKQCEKAKELQTNLNSFHIMESLEVFVYDGDNVYFHYAVGTGKDMVIHKVWLPTQSQLQEMVEEPLWQLNFKFIDWLCDAPYDGHIKHSHLNLKSMEQLWLAFCMAEKYNKYWDGTEWITT